MEVSGLIRDENIDHFYISREFPTETSKEIQTSATVSIKESFLVFFTLSVPENERPKLFAQLPSSMKFEVVFFLGPKTNFDLGLLNNIITENCDVRTKIVLYFLFFFLRSDVFSVTFLFFR
jgi:hypothetical protein